MNGHPGQYSPECREAIATEKAAEYTRLLFIIGAAQLIALIGQIAALVYTIAQSRIATQAAIDSVKASQRSAAAAERATEGSDAMLTHAKNSSEQELTAYVDVKTVQIDWQPNGGAIFTITLRNTGQTPTPFFEIGGVAIIQNIQDYSGFQLTDDIAYGPWAALGAKTEHTGVLPLRGMSLIQRDPLKKVSNNRLIVWGRVRYETVFDKLFETEFAYFSTNTDDTVVDMTTLPGKLRCYSLCEDNRAYRSEKVNTEDYFDQIVTPHDSSRI